MNRLFRFLVCVFAVCFVATVVAQDEPAGATADPPSTAPAASSDAAGGGDADPAATDAAATDDAPADAADTPADPAESGDTTDEGEEKEAEKTAVEEFLSRGAIGLLLEGGPFMWPLLIMGIIAIGVIIERYRSLKMVSNDSTDVRFRVSSMLEGDRIEEAIAFCDREQGPVPAILSAGLRKFLILRRLNYDAGKIEEQVVKGMDDYGVHVVAALERHLAILATISSAAPMIGFLGTVQGMIVAFADIKAKMGEMNIVEAAADGIGVSLLTTCLGLIVGIPAFMAFNYFTSIINRFVLDVEESATELIESVTLRLAMREQD